LGPPRDELGLALGPELGETGSNWALHSVQHWVNTAGKLTWTGTWEELGQRSEKNWVQRWVSTGQWVRGGSSTGSSTSPALGNTGDELDQQWAALGWHSVQHWGCARVPLGPVLGEGLRPLRAGLQSKNLDWCWELGSALRRMLVQNWEALEEKTGSLRLGRLLGIRWVSTWS
jgi:hypothetical protein